MHNEYSFTSPSENFIFLVSFTEHGWDFSACFLMPSFLKIISSEVTWVFWIWFYFERFLEHAVVQCTGTFLILCIVIILTCLS